MLVVEQYFANQICKTFCSPKMMMMMVLVLEVNSWRRSGRKIEREREKPVFFFNFLFFFPSCLTVPKSDSDGAKVSLQLRKGVNKRRVLSAAGLATCLRWCYGKLCTKVRLTSTFAAAAALVGCKTAWIEWLAPPSLLLRDNDGCCAGVGRLQNKCACLSHSVRAAVCAFGADLTATSFLAGAAHGNLCAFSSAPLALALCMLCLIFNAESPIIQFLIA